MKRDGRPAARESRSKKTYCPVAFEKFPKVKCISSAAAPTVIVWLPKVRVRLSVSSASR